MAKAAYYPFFHGPGTGTTYEDGLDFGTRDDQAA